MIEDQELQALVEFRGHMPVLSLYLNTDLARQSKESVKLMARNQLKEISKLSPQDSDKITRFLDFEFDWQSRGLAIFASGTDLWKTIPLPIPATTHAYYTERPYVRELTDMVDRFAQYVVAMIDSQGIRLFDIAWGSIRAEAAASGEEIKRHRQGGRSAARLQRHEDNLTLHNLKAAVETIHGFCQKVGCTRLMLAGSTEAISQVKDLMPRSLLSQIIGEFSADMEATPREILLRSLDLAYQADIADEQRMVDEAITAAAKGRAGVTGLSDTLYALHHAQVRQLLVEESYHAPGSVCTHCGFVAAEPLDRCPLCNQTAMSETADVVNRAIEKALQTGADVNIVRQNEKLGASGGIAALLRY